MKYLILFTFFYFSLCCDGRKAFGIGTLLDSQTSNSGPLLTSSTEDPDVKRNVVRITELFFFNHTYDLNREFTTDSHRHRDN